MTAKSTKTNKATNHDAPQAPAQDIAPANTDHDQITPLAEDTAAEASTPEPAASPTHQPAVDTPTAADKGDGTNQEAGDDLGLNMTSHDYDALHGLTSNVHDDSATGEQPPLALLTAERIGLTPRQHVTSIIAGGVISGILARTKPYEVLDLRKAAEAIGMCDTIVDMILHLDDPAPEAPDEQPNS
ncbi:hypothetical protein [Akkermansia sp.]|uniref:hypothetical protein n=1 Tax=Akkermansia sp. TaxID=1872421 RepID=UPI003AB3B19F